MKRILAIANQKGGVGKTTTTVNLAASIAQAGHRVLVVDMDPQANATSGLGFPKGVLSEGIYEGLAPMAEHEAPRPLRELTQLTEVPNLWLLPSTRDLAGAEVELVNVKRREFRLRDALSPIANQYDYIVIDCPPSLGLLTLNALVAATAVVIPMQCEYYALEGLSHLAETIEQVKTALNPELEIEGILLTMVDPRMNLTQQVAEEVRSHFVGKVYQTTIPRNVRLSEAPSHGKPILLYDQRSSGCQSYLALAQEFLHRERLVAA
ncbi:MAG: ParA family protein [Caldimonas sp.]